MINHITPNRSFWISSEPSPESLQIVQNFAGWKLSAVYVNQTNVNVKSTTKLGGKAGDQQKHRWPRPTQSPLRTTTADITSRCYGSSIRRNNLQNQWNSFVTTMHLECIVRPKLCSTEQLPGTRNPCVERVRCSAKCFLKKILMHCEHCTFHHSIFLGRIHFLYFHNLRCE